MNTKQKLSLLAGVAFLAFASFSGQMAELIGPGTKFTTFMAIVFGVICIAGVWALGLKPSTDPDNDEMMNAIK